MAIPSIPNASQGKTRVKLFDAVWRAPVTTLAGGEEETAPQDGELDDHLRDEAQLKHVRDEHEAASRCRGAGAALKSQQIQGNGTCPPCLYVFAMVVTRSPWLFDPVRIQGPGSVLVQIPPSTSPRAQNDTPKFRSLRVQGPPRRSPKIHPEFAFYNVSHGTKGSLTR